MNRKANAEDFRKDQERTKKELCDIKAMESRLLLSMGREERRAKLADRKTVDKDIMEWRQQRVAEMKEYVEEQKKERLLRELQESRVFQDFKKDCKMKLAAEELEAAQDLYIEDVEISRQRLEQLKAETEEERRMVLEAHLEQCSFDKEHRAAVRAEDKLQEVTDREMETRLQQDLDTLLINRKKEEMLESLNYIRMCSNERPQVVGAIDSISA